MYTPTWYKHRIKRFKSVMKIKSTLVKLEKKFPVCSKIHRLYKESQISY